MSEKLSKNLISDFNQMIWEDLEEFIASENCCMQLPTFHPEFYQNCIKKQAADLNLNSKINRNSDGIKCVQIYKNNCNSCFEVTQKFQLTDTSRKVIFKFLNETNNALSLNERLDLTPGTTKPIGVNGSKPRVQVYRFSMGSVAQNLPSIPPAIKMTNPDIIAQRISMLVYQYRNNILDIISKNQVVAICGKSGIGKSSQIPQYILENATERFQHCRIIFGHIHQISAMNTSRIVANEREEKLGTIIGYQIRLKSVSSNSTNLLFTTNEFFLRCLMGINAKDAFYGVTHVVIDDIHERSFYADLLLFELKEILSFYPNLKIIFLSCESKNLRFLCDYFKNIKILNIKSLPNIQISQAKVFYLDEILILTKYLDLINNAKGSQFDQKYLDEIIQRYFESGDKKVFDEFVYLVRAENVPVDIQHSTLQITMLMAAGKNDAIDHLKTLINLNANIYAVDKMGKTPFIWANHSNSLQSVQLLKAFECNPDRNTKFIENLLFRYRESTKNYEDNVDLKLIFFIIKYIHENFENGPILVFLPCFEDLIKMEYIILKNKLSGQKYDIKILKLHENIQKRELDETLLSESTNNTARKIILCIDIAESCVNVYDAVYVIDSGKYFFKYQGVGEFSNELNWISKEKSERRKEIVERISTKKGICFRLYTKDEMDKFLLILKPEIMNINLDKICLFVKLLSPYTSVVEHFGKIICSPPMGNIITSLKLLLDMGALDEEENITILGSRLIDIPVDVQLGKVLIYGIILQCLDPVLTIISSLAHKDLLELPKNNEINSKKILLAKKSLAENSNSDHLVLLFLFQKWQENRSISNLKNDKITMTDFLLDANLQKICEIRSKIVGIVRAAQLIHSQGIFSMNYINLKGDNWALVKACFVAGMYPNICRIDTKSGYIKSPPSRKTHRPTKTVFHGCSVLRNLESQSKNELCQNFQSDWIIYQTKLKQINENGINFNTLVAPIPITLFAGNIKRSGELFENSANLNENNLNVFVVDNWINFLVNSTDYYLIYNLRQKFSHLFLDLLENCDNQEKLRRNRQSYSQKLSIVEIISDVLALEDEAINFQKHAKVGNRPKALPIAFASDMNLGIPENDIDFNETKNGHTLVNILENKIDYSTKLSTNSAIQMESETNLFGAFSSGHFYPQQNQSIWQVQNKFGNELPLCSANFTKENWSSKYDFNILLNKIKTFNTRYNIFKFSTISIAKSYYNINAFNTGNQFWDRLCLRILQYQNQHSIIFLFCIAENKFCGAGLLTISNADSLEFYLSEYINVDIPLEKLRHLFIHDNFIENFLYSGNCEISNELGTNLLEFMYYQT